MNNNIYATADSASEIAYAFDVAAVALTLTTDAADATTFTVSGSVTDRHCQDQLCATGLDDTADQSYTLTDADNCDELWNIGTPTTSVHCVRIDFKLSRPFGTAYASGTEREDY